MVGPERGAGRRHPTPMAHHKQRPRPALLRLVLRAAREIQDGPGVSDATFAALRGALGPAEIVDLVTTASFYCAVVRLLASLEVDVEESYMPYLQRHPLPA